MCCLFDKLLFRRLKILRLNAPLPAPISNHFKLGSLKYFSGIKSNILFTKLFGVYIIP